MDRDDLIEHLKFASELGVAGVSTDPAWRERESVAAAFSRPGDGSRAADEVRSKADATVVIGLTPVDALAAVRADIGDCTRCKL
ncbi:MAG TPA: hypothetical protein VFF43_21090, partial [Caldimonas sp.]|nr:hypothetical protein [Caldimonas sp.]